MTSGPQWAAAQDLDVTTLHGLLALRCAVFVVEQACPYLDVDGRDLLPGTVHGWVTEGDRIVAALRLLALPRATRIGRVATAADARGRGLAGSLVRGALDRTRGPVQLDAQAHLEPWYAGFGFSRSGAPFLEDGIPHVPMRLERAFE